MTRKWHNEDWRKIYTRLDGSWLALPWVARGLASDLIRYARDDGSLCDATDADEAGAELARILCAKADEVKLVKRGVSVLLADRYLIIQGGRLIVRNHADAQERLSPDARRKARQRERGSDRDKERDMSRDISGGSHADGHATVTGHSAGVESSRVESKKETHTPRAGARIGPDKLWSESSGTLTADLGDLLRLREHIDAAAEKAGMDPDVLFCRAVVEFRAYRETCSPGRVPTLAPRKLLEHWPTVWERITGTAPTGKAAPVKASGNLRRGSAPPSDFTGLESGELKF